MSGRRRRLEARVEANVAAERTAAAERPPIRITCKRPTAAQPRETFNIQLPKNWHTYKKLHDDEEARLERACKKGEGETELTVSGASVSADDLG